MLSSLGAWFLRAALLTSLLLLTTPAAEAYARHTHHAARSAPRSVKIATPASTRARVRAPFFGVVAAEAFWTTPQGLSSIMGDFDQLGVGTLRQKFEWSRIEHSQGRYDFSGYDYGVGELARRRIRILPILFEPAEVGVERASGGARRLPPAQQRGVRGIRGRAGRPLWPRRQLLGRAPRDSGNADPLLAGVE